MLLLHVLPSQQHFIKIPSITGFFTVKGFASNVRGFVHTQELGFLHT